jgi:hypothetical protein
VKSHEEMLATIQRIDHDDFSDRDPKFVRAFYTKALESRTSRGDEYRRLDAAEDDVDPADLAHRSARGANATAGSYGAQQSSTTMPPITTMAEWKRAAMALGAFPKGLRGRVLEALREKSDLVGPQVLGVFERAWEAGGLDGPSTDEELRAGAAKTDSDLQAEGRRKSAAMARAALEAPGRADAIRAKFPATARRSK